MRPLLAILIAAILLTASAGPEPPYLYYFPLIFKSEIIPAKGLAASPWYPGCTDAAAVAAEWYYNWWPAPSAGCALEARFVPMVWGEASLSQLAEAVASAGASGWLLGFNEPDFSGMTPARGAELWRAIEAAAGPGVRLVSPAPSQFAPGWLKQMALEYHRRYGSEPRFDAIGVHIYASDPAAMRAYIEARHVEWPGVPLWVTEFNGCYERDNPGLMLDIVPWLAAQPYVARWAWFVSRADWNPDSASACTLLAAAGQLTPAGAMYAGY